ncbi:DNA recombination protein RmuC [Proteobacteria bacterium 005FR1]|nr:DNA recombination protein RmuC [Proteobacteria bacterium 005FR1]
MLALPPDLPLEALYGLAGAAGLFSGCLLTGLFWFLSRRKQRRLAEAAAENAASEITKLQAQITTMHGQITTLERELAVADSQRAHLGEMRSSLQQTLAEKDSHLLASQRENASLKARLEAEQGHYEQQIKLLKDARENLNREFENLANKIFESKQQQFAQSSKSSLEGTLNPLREQLKDFRKQVEDVYHKEAAERNKLVGQITELQKQTQQIGQDAVNLAAALKGSNKAQGNWGEVILERLLEESGLQKGREYETQVNLKDEDGKRRKPDVIVRLPENKDIVIDAKVSLVSYEAYCGADDDEERARALRNHISSMRGHIDELSKKNYEKLDNIRTLDFVFIFVPIEAAFMLAMQHEPGLFNYAYSKHIVLVSPTTLLATLRTVENIWRYEKQNKNAERIAEMAGKLHDQFALVVESLAELGGNIERTQKAFETTQKRLHTGHGNLFNRIKKLETLGAKTKRSLPAPADGYLLEDEDELEEALEHEE